MLRYITTSENYIEEYRLPAIDFDDLYLGKPSVDPQSKNEQASECIVQYWPVWSANSIVAVLVETIDTNGSSYHLTTSIPEFIRSATEPSTLYADSQQPIPFGQNPAFKYTESDTDQDKLPINIDWDEEYERYDLPATEPTHETGSKAPARAPVILPSNAVWTDILLPIVGQEGKGVCWAAASSAVGLKLTNTYKSALSIANTLGIGYEQGGSPSDIIRALALYTYPKSATRIGSTVSLGTLAESDIRNWLNNGLPIIANLGSLGTPSFGHSVVISGWTKSPLTGQFGVKIMNPATERFELMAKDSGGSYYLDGMGDNRIYKWSRSSIVLLGWQKPYIDSTWVYMLNGGYRSVGWKNIGGAWYYFNSYGFMQSNKWISDAGKWYYLCSSGEMLTDWQQIAGVWYYLGSDGAAVTGWQFIGNYWYAFDSSCAMRKGWFQESGKWYYLRPAQNNPGTGPEGSMLANGSWSIGGKVYRFNSSGVCLNP